VQGQCVYPFPLHICDAASEMRSATVRMYLIICQCQGNSCRCLIVMTDKCKNEKKQRWLRGIEMAGLGFIACSHHDTLDVC
jgi:hypothetical protein